jgi:hypothetical protein
MSPDIANVLVLLVSVGLAFLASRWIASRWKARRRAQTQQVGREGETRQVRRARERRGK